MRKSKEVNDDILDVMRKLKEVTNRGLRARNLEAKERENLNQRLRKLLKEEEECRIAELRDWMNRLETLELAGDKKKVLEIYKMCVRNCIKVDAVFGRIEDGKFVYLDRKRNRDEMVDVPTEFEISMLDGLDMNKYERLKRSIVPSRFMFECIVGKKAAECGIKI